MTDREPDDTAADDVSADADDDFSPLDAHSGDPAEPAEDGQSIATILATAGLALAVIAGVELLLTVALGLAIDVDQLSRISRIGYAFLTQLEKSPLGLTLVLAALVTAVAARQARPGSATDRRAGLTAGLILGFAFVLAIGSVLALVARFDVADAVATQKVDGVTRRVLAIFVVRNLGAAAIALVVASVAVRTRGHVVRKRA